jgi:hypothetical protein
MVGVHLPLCAGSNDNAYCICFAIQLKMHVHSLILAFTGAALALPLASLDSEASSATMDIARAEIPRPPQHVAEHHNRKDLLKRENDAVASIDVARRGEQSEASIDIA